MRIHPPLSRNPAQQTDSAAASLTMAEAASIIIGHGIGSGCLAVPYLASRNSFFHLVIILLTAYGINLLMHLMIAELSLHHHGAQFITCLRNELFSDSRGGGAGQMGQFAAWVSFLLLSGSVLMNICGFITGSAAVLHSWLGISQKTAMLIYFILASSVVYLGMKAVGVCEKIAVAAMSAVILTLLTAVLMAGSRSLPSAYRGSANILALYSMIAFSLSAVMSVPQVVKGLQGDPARIRLSIAAGTGINLLIIFLVTWMTLVSVGSAVSDRGALTDLSDRLGGWVSVIGYLFTLLALSTSFWANTLNLRDVIAEQLHIRERTAWLMAALPCLLVSLQGLQSFVGFTRLASAVQLVTGIGIILAYARTRKRHPRSPICGPFGCLLFRLLVICGALLSALGAVIRVS